MTKYLDENGLLYLWGKLKATFLHNASEGRFTGVSTNTSTGLRTFNVPTIAEHIYYDSNKNSTLKDKIDTIVSQGGEPNTIETIKVNGTALTPDANKAVNITFTDNDTKNTAGSTNSNSKLYLIGATSQAANPQTYSRAAVYVGTDGKLRSGFGVNSATDAQSIVVTNKDITYDMSTSSGDTIAIIDKTTGKVKPSGESFDSILEGFIDGINGINANDDGWWFNYAICNTESNEAAKTATLISGSISTVLDNNNLPTYKEGTQVVVKFTNKNTESDPTLNINNVGAKEIHINGWPISGELNAGALNNFVLLEYDGTYWNIVGPTTTSSIVWDGGGSVFDQNKSLSGCLTQLNGDMQTLTGRAIKTVGYDTTTHTITTTKVPSGSTAQNVVTAAQIVSDGGGAPIASPALTGTPTAPTATAGTNTTQIATTAFVTTAINNAIGGVTGITYEVVQTLPASGSAGTIYLISNSGTNPNIYDEYIYVNNGFEKIGTTDVDLTGYWSKTELVVIPNTTIDYIVANNALPTT